MLLVLITRAVFNFIHKLKGGSLQITTGKYRSESIYLSPRLVWSFCMCQVMFYFDRWLLLEKDFF